MILYAGLTQRTVSTRWGQPTILDKFFASRSTRGRGSSSSAANEGSDWKKIWQANAPGKMKIHLWRFAQDCFLPGSRCKDVIFRWAMRALYFLWKRGGCESCSFAVSFRAWSLGSRWNKCSTYLFHAMISCRPNLGSSNSWRQRLSWRQQYLPLGIYGRQEMMLGRIETHSRTQKYSGEDFWIHWHDCDVLLQGGAWSQAWAQSTVNLADGCHRRRVWFSLMWTRCSLLIVLVWLWEQYSEIMKAAVFGTAEGGVYR
jgi:hypothetical protein